MSIAFFVFISIAIVCCIVGAIFAFRDGDYILMGFDIALAIADLICMICRIASM